MSKEDNNPKTEQLLAGLGALMHDLKQPLGLIPHYLTKLSSEYEIPENSKDLSRIKSLLHHSLLWADNGLTGNAILLGRLSLNQVAQVLNDLVSEAVEPYLELCNSIGIELELNLDDQIGVVPLDPIHFSRLVHNLISNALKFTAPGGRITISTTALNEMVEIQVQDTGSGIANEDLPHIFDPFYTKGADSNEQNSGLGLFIVKSIAEAHGGQVIVESSPEGSAFRVLLPVA